MIRFKRKVNVYDHYCSYLSSAIQFLRDDLESIDVVLIAEGCHFPAHQIILSAASPVLKEVLMAVQSIMEPVVTLDGITAKNLKMLLEFMYLGEVNVKSSQWMSLIQTANYLKIKGFNSAAQQLNLEHINSSLSSKSIQNKSSVKETSKSDFNSEKCKKEKNSVSPRKRLRSETNCEKKNSDKELLPIAKKEKRMEMKNNTIVAEKISEKSETSNESGDENQNLEKSESSKKNKEAVEKEINPVIEIQDFMDELLQIELPCRSVRIGSYKYVSGKSIKFSRMGFQLNVPLLEDETKIVSVDIKIKDISRTQINFGKFLPAIFFSTTTEVAKMIRKAVGMKNPEGPYYDPEIQEDDSRSRITILPTGINEDTKYILKKLFHNRCEELNSMKTNILLLQNTPKDALTNLKANKRVSNI